MYDLKIIFDIIVICLLLPTIIYMIVLNQRIKTLRAQKEDFMKLISVFNDVTVKAENSLSKIKSIGETSGVSLKELIKQASVLREDLAFTNDRAAENIDGLEKLIRRVEQLSDADKKSVSKMHLHANSYETTRDKKRVSVSDYGKNNQEDDVKTIMRAIESAKKYGSDGGKSFGIRDGDDEHTEMERGLLNDIYGMNIGKKEE